MKLLLDTHIWLWSYGHPELLGTRVRMELDDPANEAWLSPVSTWEAIVLMNKGRLTIDADEDWIVRSAMRFREAPLTHQIVRAAYRLPLPYRDPADRFIAATAQVLDLTLVTADANLLALRQIDTLANR